MLSKMAPGDLVVGMDARSFRAMFREICEEDLGLKRMRFKPYSLRRGGATRDFRGHGSLDRCQLRGRWKTVAAARVYILEGVEMAVRLGRTTEEELRVLRAVVRMKAEIARRTT